MAVNVSPGAQTFVQKMLARACGRSATEVGEIVDAAPDVALSHDNTAPIRDIWSSLGQSRLEIADKMAITLDHAVPAPTPRHAKNHAEIRRFVAEQGIENFFEVGRGICHQVLSEEALVLPGQLVVGADSHTPHFGWMGAMGVGIGRSEMAVVWATGEIWLRVPESLRIELTGELSPWVSAKDLALHLIGLLGADGGLYKSVELVGNAVAEASLESRATLANMMAEFGVKNAWLPADDKTLDYLTARRKRRLDRHAEKTGTSPPSLEALRESITELALYPDDDAQYEAQHTIDASTLKPQVACPHRVDHTVSVDELGDVRVDQAFLGTCTNGRLEDLEVAHRIVHGRRLATGTRLLIVPASSEVLEEAIRRGWVSDFLAAGAVLGTPGCGPCMGNHHGVLAPGEVCISSANRNFKGRMGTPEAEIYLASPAVVAASAIAGRIVSPADVMEGARR